MGAEEFAFFVFIGLILCTRRGQDGDAAAFHKGPHLHNRSCPRYRHGSHLAPRDACTGGYLCGEQLTATAPFPILAEHIIASWPAHCRYSANSQPIRYGRQIRSSQPSMPVIGFLSSALQICVGSPAHFSPRLEREPAVFLRIRTSQSKALGG